ncbi:Hypothetical protein R9X50_00037900 [Acrodontium crateriforme]|uniref:Cyclin N-terminal domain-containing protein n=1 Tax=Acrodontium crateriforme TaxID=150365 RepID=A0AAQ3R6T8_9PEZI|nr:Hypothetical protein R9X50_00037900 [Acrodontium crateriforme]
MSWILPPSPASCVDSLDGIDDLDAFLAAQGPLSHFATPPLKSPVVVDIAEVSPFSDSDETLSFADDDSAIDDQHVAGLLAAEAGAGKYSTFFETVMIQDMLQYVLLPLDILALSLNILGRYRSCAVSLKINVTSVPSDLLTVAAFAVALSYTSDHPPRSSYWSHRVCDHNWSVKRIDATIMHVLQTIDWRLHDLTTGEALEAAKIRLQPPPATLPPLSDPIDFKHMPLRIAISDSIACWVNGQLTPASSPDSIAPQPDNALNTFLRLL